MVQQKEDISALIRVKKLEKSLDRASFDCGKETLNDWFKKFAWSEQSSNCSCTYVLMQDKDIIGFYTICPASFKAEDTVVRLGQGQPKGKMIPVIKLACLAVDKRFQKCGMGEALLKNAMLKCLKGQEAIGGRAVVVDAIDDEVIAFYQKYGFESGVTNKKILVLMMKDLKQAYANVQNK